MALGAFSVTQGILVVEGARPGLVVKKEGAAEVASVGQAPGAVVGTLLKVPRGDHLPLKSAVEFFAGFQDERRRGAELGSCGRSDKKITNSVSSSEDDY